MRQLSPAGQSTVQDIAQRHGFSTDAVTSMLASVINGNGSMAQFSHPEFSGSGQWMRGGMTMVSDMFNNHLKGRVDALCSELANLIANQPSPGWDAASLFVPPAPGTSGDWWPADLRFPNSTGAQNGVRYAHFAQARRLVIELNGHVTVYDTLDHNIGGFSQQQSYGGTISFNSQYGLIDVASLPVISVDGVAQQAPPAPRASVSCASPAPAQPFSPAPWPANNAPPLASQGNDVFATIERLAELRAKGVLSDDEFNAKKAELLARL